MNLFWWFTYRICGLQLSGPSHTKQSELGAVLNCHTLPQHVDSDMASKVLYKPLKWISVIAKWIYPILNHTMLIYN